ncbi:MAG: ATP-binding protein [Anaerolineae bacterium]|nr:ATP-binding protein [Anaerolineae bacterium]
MVRDNGPGISSEDLPHIFKRFYRGEKARRRSQDGKGFGLGLSIANWIIKNHDGKIEVETAPGRGTTFCVWLPLLPEISAPTPPAQSPDAAAPVGKGSLPH